LKEKTRRKPPREKAPDTASAEDRQSGGGSSAIAELRERKEAALADKIQLQTEIMRGDLVLREIVTSAIGGIYSVYRNQFLDIDLSQGDVLCAIVGIPPEKGGEVRKILSEAAYSCVRETMEKVTAFIEGDGEKSEPAPPQKDKKEKHAENQTLTSPNPLHCPVICHIILYYRTHEKQKI